MRDKLKCSQAVLTKNLCSKITSQSTQVIFHWDRNIKTGNKGFSWIRFQLDEASPLDKEFGTCKIHQEISN